MGVQYLEDIDRRKESTTRYRVMGGSGQFMVNGKLLEEYFTRVGDPEIILAPFEAAGENRAQIDVTVIVKGGGVSGQTGAVQLGLARALTKMNPDFRSAMRKAGFLTRDARGEERKDTRLKRSLKAPTYTKR